VNMLGKEQLQYFYGWLHTAIAGLYVSGQSKPASDGRN
jgi:hypothetical protein